MRFSQRQGITPAEKLSQRESIDTDLRNSLWNALVVCYLSRVSFNDHSRITRDSNLFSLIQQLWLHYFKQPIDNIPYLWKETEFELKNTSSIANGTKYLTSLKPYQNLATKE
ncbi:AbiJ-NTD4 domain-containing protein [Pseudomonas nitroreducens]|uniref:AbiJ-NTD4 domain-containing protein n=1 Tax=Pseudomonas nitroreducens TaxID=46680 RepID=UPI003FA6F9A9